MPDPEPGALLAGLSSRQRTEWRQACEAAVRHLEREPTFQRDLLDLLREGAPRQRFAAAWVLFHGQGPRLRLLPALLDALELADGDARWAATQMVAALARVEGEAREVLLHEARHADSARRRRMALYAIREVAPERPETEAALLAGLDDADAGVRRAALSSLGKLYEPGEACLVRTLAVLEGEADLALRRIAAVLVPDLVRHHPQLAADGRAHLERARAQPDPPLRRAAELALRRLDEASAAAFLPGARPDPP